ncbi:MAG: hypothetical protein HZA50_03390 [Planctomycetes bacterium]|nr:hypothetical protein [Planctomycetota bacterium]
MKRIVLTAVLAAGFCWLAVCGGPAAIADDKDFGGEVSVDAIPASAEDFGKLREKLGNSPKGTAAAFIVALLMLEKDKELGTKCAFSIVTDSYQNASGGQSQDFKELIERFVKNPAIARSYVVGTSLASGYELPKGAFKFSFSTNKYSVIKDTHIKLFTACSGADTPRPIEIKKIKDAWQVENASSLSVGVKK